ncbi:hypothetical protein [Geobacter sp. AOG1]|uniref:hypothetical protein n=1 Tax=Geobacter sp. AOG1 TaxID=1566346 RepID=UPI001CC6689E|nr:hypothetical protein [Geobacter sp. AOG1]
MRKEMMINRLERLLPLTLSFVGGWLAYSSVKVAIKKEISDSVELIIGAVLFGGFSIWLAKEAILSNRRLGWLTSAGLLFYCMLRHMTPLLAQGFAHTIGKAYLNYDASYGEPVTYIALSAFYAFTGYLCLKKSKSAHNQEDTPDSKAVR